MATVESWFNDFAAWFMSSLRRTDWPSPTTPAGRVWWDMLRSRMVHHGVRREEVFAACALLFDSPPGHIDHVWPELLAAVKACRESRRAAGTTPAALDPAETAAWDAAAEEYWDSLAESERREARDLVRGRLPELAHRPGWVEGLAKGWAFDPSFVAGVSPPPRDRSWSRATPQYPKGDPRRAPDVGRLPGDPTPGVG